MENLKQLITCVTTNDCRELAKIMYVLNYKVSVHCTVYSVHLSYTAEAMPENVC